MADSTLKTLPLAAAHRAQGGRMVPFAGYEMPVQYEDGIIAEHNWTRKHAGIFDVSHMGQAKLIGPDDETTARALETLVPADILTLKIGQQRYTQLLSSDGGIIDDLMVTRVEETGRLNLVVNAGRASDDYAHIAKNLPANVHLRSRPERALLAIQGPKAAAILSEFASELATMPFMTARQARLSGIQTYVSRSGYTGEDGFEISLESRDAQQLWAVLTDEDEAKPIGLGARDTLRLEAGLCLYGHDIDLTTSPIEAGLSFSIQKRRRAEGGFMGAARIQKELSEGPARRRVGFLLEGRQPAREGNPIVDPKSQKKVGTITSGGFAPSLNAPIAMGYVPSALAMVGTRLDIMVRDKPLTAQVVALPFVLHRYFRGA